MFKIDSPSAVSVMPTPSPSGTPGWFAHGNGTSVPYTVLTSDWANAVQAELLSILTAAGLVPDKTNQAQVLSAIQTLGRIKLTSDLQLYVSPSGSDSNTGLSSGSPFQTIQHAWNVIAQVYDGGGYQAYMNLHDGTYTSGLYTVYPAVGFNAVHIVGNTGTPSNVLISVTNSPGISFSLPGVPAAYVSGVKITATGTAGPSDLGDQGYGLVARDIMLVEFTNVEFGACSVNHIWAGRGGCVHVAGSYKISGSSLSHYACGNGGMLFATPASASTVTITGTPAFATSFAYANIFGNMQTTNLTFSGSATGTRYISSLLSSIATNGAGASYFPGNSAGSTLYGGQYT